MSKITARSIWFVSVVGIGLTLAYIDGATMAGVAKAGLFFSTGFVFFLVGEAAYSRFRKKK